MANLIKTVDVSSHQRPSLEALNGWVGEGCQLLWVHSYHSGERAGLADSTRGWIGVAKQAGAWCLPYCWLFNEGNAARMVQESIQVYRDVGEDPRIVALDCENFGSPVTDRGPTAEQILEAAERARSLGVEPVLYSGKWWLDDIVGDIEILRGVPAWLAHYDRRQVLDIPHPDWVEVIGHQYTDQPVDWSVFDLDALKALTAMH